MSWGFNVNALKFSFFLYFLKERRLLKGADQTCSRRVIDIKGKKMTLSVMFTMFFFSTADLYCNEWSIP